MKQRIIAALIMIPITVAVLLANDTVVFAAMTFLSLAAAYEICESYGFGLKSTPSAIVFLMLVPIVVELLTVSALKKYVDPGLVKFLFFMYLMAGFAMILLNYEKIKVRNVMSAMALCSAVTFFFSHAMNIRTDCVFGRQLLWLVIICACLTDTFALFVGKYFGKRKLAPKISPKKTVAGALGGILGSVISATVYGVITELTMPEISVNFLSLAALGLVAAIFAQLGDLSMSAVKREAGIKDYGNIIPGHGGILDRIDSIVFTAPLVYYFVMFFKVFY